MQESKETKLSDEELLRQSQKNPSFFEELLSRYEEPFKRKARGILGDRDEIDDIVQETFLKIYMNADRFRTVEGASFKSWGYKILINTTFTYYQKLKKYNEREVHLETEFYEALPDEKEEVTGEISNFVASILVRMPRHLARVLRLHFIDGVPQKEIAELEGISQSAVKTRVHRAKKEYRKIDEQINRQI
ncbi:MAG: RNA polymerase sigma factor [Candidatus Paceibacterota bacterium]